MAGLASGRSSHNCAKAESRLFPERVFYSASDPTRGRFRGHVRDDAQTITSSPDLCKSGGYDPENINIFRGFSTSQQANRS